MSTIIWIFLKADRNNAYRFHCTDKILKSLSIKQLVDRMHQYRKCINCVFLQERHFLSYQVMNESVVDFSWQNITCIIIFDGISCQNVINFSSVLFNLFTGRLLIIDVLNYYSHPFFKVWDFLVLTDMHTISKHFCVIVFHGKLSNEEPLIKSLDRIDRFQSLF